MNNDKKKCARVDFLSLSLGAGVFGIAFITGLGYLFGKEILLNWGLGPQLMAANTSAAFMLTGAAIMVLSIKKC